MGHRQVATDDLAALDINDHTTAAPVFTPPFMHVAGAHCRYVVRGPVFHGQSVQMTAIFCPKTRNERRLPNYPETVRLARSRQTGKECVDEGRLFRRSG